MSYKFALPAKNIQRPKPQEIIVRQNKETVPKKSHTSNCNAIEWAAAHKEKYGLIETQKNVILEEYKPSHFHDKGRRPKRQIAKILAALKIQHNSIK